MSFPRRRFLFLQGPPGPFFRQLGEELARRAHGVHRINLCGGDLYDWPKGGSNYRGLMKNWPLFLSNFIRTHGITDMVLYGDCRPMHHSALGLARLGGVRIHVFEEGYIRPNWMTLERDGVNGHSSLVRDPDVILAAAQWLPEIPELPNITSAFGRRARDSYWHYHYVVIGRIRFPFYKTHRPGSIIAEGIGWILRFARASQRARQAEEALKAIVGRKYFLFPLQLTGDYQIRTHSPFLSMRMAADYVLDSFARNAPDDALLLVKEHPLEVGFGNWRSYLQRRARHFGLDGRVMHIDGGDLQVLAEGSAGMVVVNSTSGTLGLEVGTPVIVLGDAVYEVPGITHHGLLDNFWSDPEAPSPQLYQAFKKLLHAKCLVRGGLASESASKTLIANSIDRLLSESSAPPRQRLSRVKHQAFGTSPASFR